MHDGSQPAVRDDASRTAFTLAPVHTRRDDARITAVTVDPKLHRLFLGLSTGYVEEHQLLTQTSGGVRHGGVTPRSSSMGSWQQAAGTRIVSGRKVSRHAVADLCCLPVAQRLVSRGTDGSVVICPYEGAELFPVDLLKKTILLAGDGRPHGYARLAAVVKPGGITGGAASRLIVCMVGGGTATPSQPVQPLANINIPEPVLGLAWAGNNVLVALPDRYRLVASGGAAADVVPHSCGHPLAAPAPASGEAALLLSDTMVVVVDSTGQAVSTPLLLEGTPVVLACSGPQLVAVTDEAVEVYDRLSGGRLQSIPFTHDDAWVQAARRMAWCEDWDLQQVLFATSTVLYCLSPVSEESQVLELLKKRRYAPALSLIAACSASAQLDSADVLPTGGSPALPPVPAWCAAAVAQAALQLLQDCAFLPALALLLHLPTSVWQPCQLLHLFPSEASRWLHDVPRQHPRGAHGALNDLRTLVANHVELQHAAVVRQTSSRRASRASGHGGPTLSPMYEEPHDAQQEQETAALFALGQALVAAYLLQVRSAPDVALVEALDALLLQLAVAGGAGGVAEALVATPGFAAPLRDAVTLLTSAKRWHALALLRVAHNHTEEALDIWARMGAGQVAEEALGSWPGKPDKCPVPDLPLLFHSLRRVLDRAGVGRRPDGASAKRHPAAGLLPVLPELPDLARNVQVMPDVYEQACSHWVEILVVHGLPRPGWAQGFGTATHEPSSPAWEGSLPRSGLDAAGRQQQALAAAATAALLSFLPLHDETSGGARTTSPAPPPGQLVGAGSAAPLARLHSSSEPLQPQRCSRAGPPPVPSAKPSGASHTTHTVTTAAAASGKPPLAQWLSDAEVWSDAHVSGVALPVMAVPKDPVPPERVLPRLPQLLRTFPGDALAVITARLDLPLAAVLRLLKDRTDDVRWRYLHHVAYSQPPTDAWMPPATTGHDAPPSTALLHTELALELVEAIERELAGQATNGHPPSQPTAAPPQLSPQLSASLAPGPAQPPAVATPTSRLEWLVGALDGHLHASSEYDPGVVLAAVHEACPGGALRRQEVQLHRRLGQHGTALRLLVVELGDVDSGIAYCKREQAGPPPLDVAAAEALWMTLLECCLRPGPGLEPMYAAALRVLAAPSMAGGLGGGMPYLDPLKVLSALPDGMPLSLASATLSSMLVSSGHRKRNAQVLKALCRSQNLGARAESLQLCTQKVVLNAGSTCHMCFRLMGTKIFTRLPSGALLCQRCASSVGAAGSDTATAAP